MNVRTRGALLAAGVAVGAVCSLTVRSAAADIYKSVDASGTITYSDLPPKDRSHVVEVFRAPNPPSPAELAAQQASELRAVTARLEQLADELAQARRAAETPRFVAAPPEPPSSGACDPRYADCGSPGPSWYAPATVVVGVPFFRRFHHPGPHRFFAPRTGGRPPHPRFDTLMRGGRRS